MIVVSDTGPLNYLILIEESDLLPRLFQSVLIPRAVFDELNCGATPFRVRDWLGSAPSWLVIEPDPASPIASDSLGVGECAAIALARDRACTLLCDDRNARTVARAAGLHVVGTIGLLLSAAKLGYVDFSIALSRLRGTNFRASPALIERALKELRESSGN